MASWLALTPCSTWRVMAVMFCSSVGKPLEAWLINSPSVESEKFNCSFSVFSATSSFFNEWAMSVNSADLRTISVKRAAAAAGVGLSTLFRWLNEDTFNDAYLDARRKSMQQTTARLQRFSSEATSILEDIVKGKHEPTYARVNAIKMVLQSAFTGLELDDLSNRLADIETRLKESADDPNY